MKLKDLVSYLDKRRLLLKTRYYDVGISDSEELYEDNPDLLEREIGFITTELDGTLVIHLD